MLSATSAAGQGEEALLCYASQGSAAFLAMYGFVPERNPFAAMELFDSARHAAAWALAAYPPPVRHDMCTFSAEQQSWGSHTDCWLV